MSVFLISYDLKNSSERDYQPIHQTIRSFGAWWHYLESTWIINPSIETITSLDISNRIIQHLQPGDRLIVVQIDQMDRNGWLPKNAWVWIRNHEETDNRQEGEQSNNV